MTRSNPFPQTRLDSTASTSSDAEDRIASGLIRGPHLVTARSQTAGRGSRGRSWTGLAGNLFASFAVPENPAWTQPHLATYAAALAQVDAVAPLTHAPPQVKWPNDLTLGGAKFAGTLVTRTTGPAGPFLVIGIGINVAHHPNGTPYPATHINAHSDTRIDLEQLTLDLSIALDDWLNRWTLYGFLPIRDAYLRHAPTNGSAISFQPRGCTERLSGTFAGIADDGALLITRGSVTEAHYAGDLVA